MQTAGTNPEAGPGHAVAAVALDIGNVLLDFDFSAVVAWASKSAGKIPGETARWLACADIYDRLERGTIGAAEFFDAARRELGLKAGFDEFKAVWNGIFTDTKGMAGLVRRLRGRFVLVAASNTNRLHLDHIIAGFSVMSMLDGVVASCDVGARKPERAFYDAVARACGRGCPEIVFVDDIEANVEGAVAAGMRGILFRGAADLEERLALLGVRA